MMRSTIAPASVRGRWLLRAWVPAGLLLAMTLGWFAVRTVHGLHFEQFGDETGHLLGARAIRAGDVLYRDFIDAHGPFPFIVAHLYGTLFGWKDPLAARRAIPVMILLAAAAIATCPALRGATARLWSAALFVGLVAGAWLLQALHMVNYHVMGGALTSVALAWLAVPAWLGAPITRGRAAVAGCALAWLCACAYALAPTALLLAAGSGCALMARRGMPARPVLQAAALGFAVGAALILCWMLRFADLLGYLVFHIINMQVNYARFTPWGWQAAVHSLVPSLQPVEMIQTGAALVFDAAVLLLGWLGGSERPRPGPLGWAGYVLIVAAIFMLNFRGAFTFQDGGFLVAGCALFALVVPAALERRGGAATPTRAWAGTLAFGLLLGGAEFFDRAAAVSPPEILRREVVRWAPVSLRPAPGLPAVRRVNQVLHPGERLLVLEYDPSFFLLAGRLPIRKFHEYLPWEADYAKAPWFGLKRDLCEELRLRPPPVIVYTPWKVWGAFEPESFMPCLDGVLRDQYVADPVPSVFIRRDRAG